MASDSKSQSVTLVLIIKKSNRSQSDTATAIIRYIFLSRQSNFICEERQSKCESSRIWRLPQVFDLIFFAFFMKRDITKSPVFLLYAIYTTCKLTNNFLSACNGIFYTNTYISSVHISLKNL